MNYYSYSSFNYDGCYSRPSQINEASFNNILTTKFDKTSVRSVKECESQSLRNNSDFFLINDISTSLNTSVTNCYIPKRDYTNQTLFGTTTRAKQLFDELFKTTSPSAPYITQPQTPPIANNLLYNKNRTNTNQLCFKYAVDNQYYTPRNYYAYYKKPILDEANIRLLNTMRTNPTYYENKLNDTTEAGLKYYDELLKLGTATFQNSGPLVQRFKEYICNLTSSAESDLDAQIVKLNDQYNKFDNSLDAIQRDLSAINYLNSFDDNTLRALNSNIVTKKQELNNLLGSGGANNGRLDDTTLLTQFKIVENSILLLLIVCAIFFLTKSKKTIVAS
jgi:hypothetical protein